MGRRPCCSKEGLNRGAWTAIEDKILVSYINTHGEGKWRDVPQRAGLKRCGKSCRLRWLNYLRPDIKRGNISHEEEELIIRLHNLLGNRWSLIAGRLPGRTDNEIKNYWNTTLGKKLFLGTGSISTQDQDQTQTQTQQDLNVALDQNPITQQIRITDSTSNVVRTKAIRCTKVVSCCTQLNEINNQLVQESDYKQGHAQGNGDNLVAVASDDHDDITEEIRGLSFDANSNSELSFDHEQILGDWMPMPMHMDLKALTSLLDFGEDWFNLTKLI